MQSNAQQEMDTLLSQLKLAGKRPRLLLHCCCAPCASYVLEYLCESFSVTVFYCNPNIYPREECDKREAELKRLIELMPCEIGYLQNEYDEAEFLASAHGLEGCPEGGSRCQQCFALRLEKTAQAAFSGGYDYFATTLTVSPHKNAAVVNEQGQLAAQRNSAHYLPSDFKKHNGYLRSIKLCEKYGIYRQNYCGCRFSLQTPQPKGTPNND